MVTVKSEKGNKLTRKDVDMELKLKGKMKGARCYRDGTSAVFEK